MLIEYEMISIYFKSKNYFWALEQFSGEWRSSSLCVNFRELRQISVNSRILQSNSREL